MKIIKGSRSPEGTHSEEWRCYECRKLTPFNEENLFPINFYSLHDAGLFQYLKGLFCDKCDPRPKPKPTHPTGNAA